MVQAKWEGRTISEQKLVVRELTSQELATLPAWVSETVEICGIAVCNGIAYATDEATARNMLEW